MTVYKNKKPPRLFCKLFQAFGYRYKNGFSKFQRDLIFENFDTSLIFFSTILKEIHFESKDQIRHLLMWENNILEECSEVQEVAEKGKLDFKINESLER
jgi:hypothetical protein